MNRPTYPLAEVKALMTKGRWVATVTARNDALSLGFDDDDILDCIAGQLAETHFYKTMEAKQKLGYMQDVYRITYQAYRIYLKVQIVDENTVVISFKEDESGG